jgi:excisionase family DNA binding protein
MTSRSGRERWGRVLAARSQSRVALGQGSEPGLYGSAPKPSTPLRQPPGPKWTVIEPWERSERGLSLGEAAARLNVSRPQLEAMISTGHVEALSVGLTRMIPTREVKRLLAPRH